MKVARCMLENNIKMDFRELKWDGMDWICLVQDRDWWNVLVNMIMNQLSFTK
jgi:hypothetical protein